MHASPAVFVDEPRKVAPSSSSTLAPAPFYTGPLARTFRNLKLFSLSSLGLITGLSPVIFVIDAPGIPMSARCAMVGTALAMSGASTGLIAWSGAPYVSSMRRLAPLPAPTASARAVKTVEAPNGTSASISANVHPDAVEMATKTLFLRDMYTQVYDPAILGPTNRLFATWELQPYIRAPADANNASRTRSGAEEVIARTLDSEGKIRGEWRVSWTQDTADKKYLVGHASATGEMLRYVMRTRIPCFIWPLTSVQLIRHFNVHEELLASQTPTS